MDVQQRPVVVDKPYAISEIIPDTPDVTVFKFKSQDGTKLAFDPGMFVMLGYHDDATKERIARAFSIASLPNSDTLEFYISMIHGRFTSKLDTAKVGDIYYVSGPHGQFKFSPAQDKKVLFIAGGTGLAPFMSMLKEIKEQGSDNDVVLLYSVRHASEIIRKAELEQLGMELGIKTFITVTRPQENSEGWQGETGHIDQGMIRRLSPDLLERQSYICGPLGFVKAVKEALLALNLPEEKIKADVWG
jgi:ferredoxin-NADP reductase